MRLGFLNPDTPLLEPDRKSMSPQWVRWLRFVWELFGFSKDTPIYDEVFVGGNQMEESAGDTSLIQISGALQGPQMRTAQEDARIGVVRLPNRYKDGSDIIPFIEWCPANENTGNVVLRLSYAGAPEGSVLTQATSTETDAVPGADNQVTRTVFDAIDGSDFTKGTILVVRALRLGNHASNTYAASIILLGVGVKYQIEGIGNEQANP